MQDSHFFEIKTSILSLYLSAIKRR